MEENLQVFPERPIEPNREELENVLPLPLKEYNICQVVLAATMGYGAEAGDTRWVDEGHAERFEHVIKNNPNLRRMALKNPEDPALIEALRMKMLQ
ncbi:MAG: hypothetical protein HYY51_00280 [Candidatus Magasanikbacteria bacterium]|nr:hypothetical protein [Candidatus Magasanikbacteria bacterium]